jgi:hypothetical protein
MFWYLDLPALCTGVPGPCRQERLVLGLGRESHATAHMFGAGAECLGGTGLTVLQGELHDDRPTAGPRPVLPPRGRPFALRAANPLLRPIDLELVDRVRPFYLRLPAWTRPGWTSQGNPVLLTALDEQFRVVTAQPGEAV